MILSSIGFILILLGAIKVMFDAETAPPSGCIVLVFLLIFSIRTKIGMTGWLCFAFGQILGI